MSAESTGAGEPSPGRRHPGQRDVAGAQPLFDIVVVGGQTVEHASGAFEGQIGVLGVDMARGVRGEQFARPGQGRRPAAPHRDVEEVVGGPPPFRPDLDELDDVEHVVVAAVMAGSIVADGGANGVAGQHPRLLVAAVRPVEDAGQVDPPWLYLVPVDRVDVALGVGTGQLGEVEVLDPGSGGG